MARSQTATGTRSPRSCRTRATCCSRPTSRDGGEYRQGEHGAFDRAACAVACSIVSRAVNVPLGLAGASQYSQTAGSYNASVTFANPTAELWVGKADLKRLGLAGCRIGSIDAMTGADRA